MPPEEFEDVLRFWFPQRNGDHAAMVRQFAWWFRGGADSAVAERFPLLLERATRGELDYWSHRPGVRLVLIIVLDRFSRSLHRGDAALRVLQRCIGNHAKHVFTYWGNLVKGVDNNTWKRACRRAGIEDFRWHDLRHTWASWHVQAGTAFMILMELGGWSSYEMVLRYAHLASAHLYHAADKIDLPEVKTARDRGTLVTNQLRCKVVPLPVRHRNGS